MRGGRDLPVRRPCPASANVVDWQGGSAERIFRSGVRRPTVLSVALAHVVVLTAALLTLVGLPCVVAAVVCADQLVVHRRWTRWVWTRRGWTRRGWTPRW